jgi:hypothetical protein
LEISAEMPKMKPSLWRPSKESTRLISVAEVRISQPVIRPDRDLRRSLRVAPTTNISRDEWQTTLDWFGQPVLTILIEICLLGGRHTMSDLNIPSTKTPLATQIRMGNVERHSFSIASSIAFAGRASPSHHPIIGDAQWQDDRVFSVMAFMGQCCHWNGGIRGMCGSAGAAPFTVMHKIACLDEIAIQG